MRCRKCKHDTQHIEDPKECAKWDAAGKRTDFKPGEKANRSGAKYQAAAATIHRESMEESSELEMSG